jgi:hypothetical protein
MKMWRPFCKYLLTGKIRRIVQLFEWKDGKTDLNFKSRHPIRGMLLKSLTGDSLRDTTGLNVSVGDGT